MFLNRTKLGKKMGGMGPVTLEPVSTFHQTWYVNMCKYLHTCICIYLRIYAFFFNSIYTYMYICYVYMLSNHFHATLSRRGHSTFGCQNTNFRWENNYSSFICKMDLSFKGKQQKKPCLFVGKIVKRDNTMYFRSTLVPWNAILNPPSWAQQ